MSWKVQRWLLLAAVAVYVAMRVYRGAAICMAVSYTHLGNLRIDSGRYR